MTLLPAPLRDAPDADALACCRLRSVAPADLAALPFGVLRLAPDGRVLAWRPPAGASDPDPGPIPNPVGRLYFREIAPAELGRSIGPLFARGVATDRLNLTLEYCLGAEPQPSLWLHLGGNRRDGFLLVMRRID